MKKKNDGRTGDITIPPFNISSAIVSHVAEISEILGRLSVTINSTDNLRLRKINRIRTIHGSLAIEGNTLTEEQITAILDDKRIIAPPKIPPMLPPKSKKCCLL